MLLQINKLELPKRLKIANYANIIELDIQIGDDVICEGNTHEIISIYSECSPLCGYVLLSSIGNPILASMLTKLV